MANMQADGKTVLSGLMESKPNPSTDHTHYLFLLRDKETDQIFIFINSDWSIIVSSILVNLIGHRKLAYKQMSSTVNLSLFITGNVATYAYDPFFHKQDTGGIAKHFENVLLNIEKQQHPNIEYPTVLTELVPASLNKVISN